MVDTVVEEDDFVKAEDVDPPQIKEVSPAKKRGRPSNPNKVVKIPSGRGRGRPKKYEDGDEIPVYVNNYVPREPYSGRGRPRKLGKPKLMKTIVATGKGRGRPKSNICFSPGKLAVLKIKKSKSKGQRGRPKKSSSSYDDDEASENDDDDESEGEKRPVGRPNTGAVSLNIVATGRGQGRPKTTSAKRPLDVGIDEQPRKRGRPSFGKTIVKDKSNKPRGRPKKTETDETDHGIRF